MSATNNRSRAEEDREPARRQNVTIFMLQICTMDRLTKQI